jgi:DNA polymerase-3 subunit gamma/tau
MTYLALARKWRPRAFGDVVGQPHIVQALTNALSSGRIHHALLFAGTRGVGKTTIARILARCLNCERGVSPAPCGTCAACVAIEEGRFVDLIEVDAASRTGVDDVRELLDNVQYTPTSGRYKIYLVDEVHMLSKQAFNALLKTLEEPPPHVKFLFATTDPEKLLVTVRSRCLQFNLKRLPNALIAERLLQICRTEGIAAEAAACTRLARAAAGSMRDGLSLLDQALAFGNETLREADVVQMLGSVDRSRVLGLLQLLARGGAPELLRYVHELDELVPDYAGLLEDLATALQQLAVIQLAGAEALDGEDELLPALKALAAEMDAETTQLHYQIAVVSRRDLADAPDPRVGFEMAMLRMLAFQPARLAAPATPAAEPPAGTRAPARGSGAGAPGAAQTGTLGTPADWPAFVQALSLDGAARQLAVHSELLTLAASEIRLSVDRANAHLVTEQLKGRLAAALRSRLGSDLRVFYEIRDAGSSTPAARAVHLENEALEKARRAIAADPNVRALADVFGAEIEPDSIRPLDPR